MVNSFKDIKCGKLINGSYRQIVNHIFRTLQNFHGSKFLKKGIFISTIFDFKKRSFWHLKVQNFRKNVPIKSVGNKKIFNKSRLRNCLIEKETVISLHSGNLFLCFVKQVASSGYIHFSAREKVGFSPFTFRSSFKGALKNFYSEVVFKCVSFK